MFLAVLLIPDRRGEWIFGEQLTVSASSVQFSSVAQSCLTLCDPMNRSTPGSLSITNSRSSLKLVSIESVMPSSHLILCRPLLLLPSVFPSIRVFFSESVLRSRWLKHWSFSFSIGPSNEYSGLISIRIDKVVQCIIGWMSTSFINGLIFGSATATLEMCWNPDSWSISHV